MFIDVDRVESLPDSDVCIVGSGPIGVACALSCEKAGLSVLLLEAGRDSKEASAPAPPTEIASAERHADTAITSRRAFGGTSSWWGGRCVPFDAVDFQTRPYLGESAWPLSYDEMSEWYREAASVLRCGAASFVNEPESLRWRSSARLNFGQLERWTPEIDVTRVHGNHLRASESITVALGADVVRLGLGDGRISALDIKLKSRQLTYAPKVCVLACGGVEVTRLMLEAREVWPNSFGGAGGVLGAGYMGHISGKIADIVFSDPGDARLFDFFLDEDVYVRRRFQLSADTQVSSELLNAAFWIDNPPFHDPRHRNALLSLAWLALLAPWVGPRLVSEGVRRSHLGPAPHRVWPHIANLIRNPHLTALAIMRLLKDRYVSKPRKPGFLVKNGGGRYALHYHAEQVPMTASCVALSDSHAIGERRTLRIDLRFSEEDALSVVRSHELVDLELRERGLGKLVYRVPPQERVIAVLDQARDGFHQIGLARMGANSRNSVVDSNCRVHDLDNLYVASTAILPTGGQANPTFIAVALACRLGRHLKGRTRGVERASSIL